MEQFLKKDGKEESSEANEKHKFEEVLEKVLKAFKQLEMQNEEKNMKIDETQVNEVENPSIENKKN